MEDQGLNLKQNDVVVVRLGRLKGTLWMVRQDFDNDGDDNVQVMQPGCELTMQRQQLTLISRGAPIPEPEPDEPKAERPIQISILTAFSPGGTGGTQFIVQSELDEQGRRWIDHHLFGVKPYQMQGHEPLLGMRHATEQELDHWQLGSENRTNLTPLDRLLDEVQAELLAAVKGHAPMQNPHEGYAVLLEEMDELWDEVKKNPRKQKRYIREEAIQVAAMAIRLVHDCFDASWSKGDPPVKF